MDAQRWAAIESLYKQALAKEPGERSAYLAAACAKDPNLQNELRSLLARADKSLPDLVERSEFERIWSQVADVTVSRSGRCTPPSLQLGEVLCDRFSIVRLLGTGGMGEVYEANDRVLGESVALKTIRADIETRGDVRARFVQEVHAAKKISHANICRIHDLHQHRPTAGRGAAIDFITMELLQGETLRTRLARGPIPLSQARIIAVQLVGALDAAHRAGVIHRDFKSENVMLVAGVDDSVRAVVTDFGLARSQGAVHDILTAAGQIIGTPAYMAPEQILGDRITTAVDIYALGVVLYEMVTGTQPFTGNSPISVAARRLESQPVPPSTYLPDLPVEWDRAILRCLERNPAKRFARASDVYNTITVEDRNPILKFLNAATIGFGASLRSSFSIRSKVPVTMIVLFILAGALLMFWNSLLSHSARAKSGPSTQVYLAVLSFKPLGDQLALRYQTEGIVDALGAKLFQLPGVHLASRAAVDAMKNESPARITRRLGVNMLLNGSVQSAAGGSRITVVVNLEDAGQHMIWADRFSGSTSDLLTLEDQIYSGLVRALNVSVSGDRLARNAAHPTENVEAYDLYLQGRDAVRQRRDEASVKAALDLYTKALDKDPHFGLAYAALADASMYMYDLKKDKFWSEKALHAGAESGRWSPDIPESHVALGSAYRATGRTNEAIAEFQRALELAPNSDEACRRLASAYKDAGNKVESLKYFNKATEANPYYWMNYNQLGWAEFSFGEYNQALENYRKVTEIAPELSSGYSNMGTIYFYLGKYQESIQQLLKATQLKPASVTYADLSECYYHLGRYQEAIDTAQKAITLDPNSDLAAGNLANAYRGAKELQKAKSANEKAIALAYATLDVNPRNVGVMGRLARYYARQGQYDRARQYTYRARRMDPNDVELLFVQTVIESLSGNQSLALRHLQQAMENGFSVAQIESEPELSKLRTTRSYRALIADVHASRH
jgi:serine/threonine protein kinase/tetratricopeptide (TPR) repeat protein